MLVSSHDFFHCFEHVVIFACMEVRLEKSIGAHPGSQPPTYGSKVKEPQTQLIENHVEI